MSELTNAKQAVIDARQLNDGEKEQYIFSSKKLSNSFRVSCYTAKKELGINDVLISMEGKSVFLSKGRAAISRVRILPDGTKLDLTSTLPTQQRDPGRSGKSFDEQMQEIIELSESFDTDEAKALFIQDAIANLKGGR